MMSSPGGQGARLCVTMGGARASLTPPTIPKPRPLGNHRAVSVELRVLWMMSSPSGQGAGLWDPPVGGARARGPRP